MNYYSDMLCYIILCYVKLKCNLDVRGNFSDSTSSGGIYLNKPKRRICCKGMETATYAVPGTDFCVTCYENYIRTFLP
jgi:hypothetical protein